MLELNKNISMYDEVIISSFLHPTHQQSAKNTYKIEKKLYEKQDKNSETIYKNCWIDFPHELIDVDSNEYTMTMKCLFIPLLSSVFCNDTKNSLVNMFINRDIDKLKNKTNQYEFNNPNAYLIDEGDTYDLEQSLNTSQSTYIYITVDDRNPRFKHELLMLKKEPFFVDYYKTSNWDNHQIVLKFIYPFKLHIELFLNNELDKIWISLDKYQVLTSNPVILNTYFRYDLEIDNYYIKDLTRYLVGIDKIGETLESRSIERKINKEVQSKIKEFNIDDKLTIETLYKQVSAKYKTEKNYDSMSIDLEKETLIEK